MQLKLENDLGSIWHIIPDILIPLSFHNRLEQVSSNFLLRPQCSGTKVFIKSHLNFYSLKNYPEMLSLLFMKIWNWTSCEIVKDNHSNVNSKIVLDYIVQLFFPIPLYTLCTHYFASTKMVPKNKTKTNLLFVLVVLLQIVGISIIFKKNTNKKTFSL